MIDFIELYVIQDTAVSQFWAFLMQEERRELGRTETELVRTGNHNTFGESERADGSKG